MASFRNFTADNQGVRWDFSFEYSADSDPHTFTLFECQIPRDLQDIDADESEFALWELTKAIARGQGHDV